MTNHTNCLHPATSAGRAACRKAGSIRIFHNELAFKVRSSAPCQACFDLASISAEQNLEEEFGSAPDIRDLEADSIWIARVSIAARSYLYDNACISACSDHQHLL